MIGSCMIKKGKANERDEKEHASNQVPHGRRRGDRRVCAGGVALGGFRLGGRRLSELEDIHMSLVLSMTYSVVTCVCRSSIAARRVCHASVAHLTRVG